MAIIIATVSPIVDHIVLTIVLLLRSVISSAQQ